MEKKISKRLLNVIESLPLKPGMRILEIGCGPGAMAREMANRIEDGFVLAIDRSNAAIRQAKAGSKAQIKAGVLEFRQSKIEEFDLLPNEKRFDLAVAIRVGALDGRHPDLEKEALRRIRLALKPKGHLYIDAPGGVREIKF